MQPQPLASPLDDETPPPRDLLFRGPPSEAPSDIPHSRHSSSVMAPSFHDDPDEGGVVTPNHPRAAAGPLQLVSNASGGALVGYPAVSPDGHRRHLLSPVQRDESEVRALINQVARTTPTSAMVAGSMDAALAAVRGGGVVKVQMGQLLQGVPCPCGMGLAPSFAHKAKDITPKKAPVSLPPPPFSNERNGAAAYPY